MSKRAITLAAITLLVSHLGREMPSADAPPMLLRSRSSRSSYQDCVTHSCQLVPDKKQIEKTVYEVQEVPYCVKKLPPLWSLFCHHGCDDAKCALTASARDTRGCW